jgi:GT2 family glycosyltransferase
MPVFVVHWNRPWECIRTVECLLNQDLPLNISIVDNSSKLENYQVLVEHLPAEIEIIRLEENKGWGGGLNILLQRWLKDRSNEQNYCFISAHDALPQGQCLSILLRSAQGDPKIAIACPEYGSDNDLPCYSPVRGPRLLPSPHRSSGDVESVDFAHATLFLIRKDCLKEIGLFDERYFAYGDEYDIALKARRFNWKVVLVWGAIVINPISGTSKPILSYLFARNTLLLARTYGGWIHAISRMSLMFLNTLRLSLKPSIKRNDFHPTAKLLGIRDFLLKRYGPPPINLK